MKKMSFYFVVVCAVFLLIFITTSNVMAQNCNHVITNNVYSDTSAVRYGGFLETYWNQDFPYNQLCPKDPLNNNSYMSCSSNGTDYKLFENNARHSFFR